MDYQPAIELVLATLPDADAIYLFGSRARGDTHADSDADLAVLVYPGLDPISLFDLQERIADRLRLAVDLVDLRKASTVMQVQVLEHGVLLYEGSWYRRATFEMFALSSYTRLNEERRAILEDIAERGRVYG